MPEATQLPGGRAQVPIPSISQIQPGDGWYVKWGPTSPTPGQIEKVILFGMATDGLSVIAIVSDVGGVMSNAAGISTDFILDHPQRWNRNSPSRWP